VSRSPQAPHASASLHAEDTRRDVDGSRAQTLQSYGARLHQLGTEHPDDVALVFAPSAGAESEVTWAELDDRSTQLARSFARLGVGYGDRLAIALRNSPEHLYSAFAGWKLGAVVVPVRWDLPVWEWTRLREVIRPKFVVDASTAGLVRASRAESVAPLPDVVPPCSRGICSSGSTGTPKVIVIDRHGLVDPGVISITASIIESYGQMPHPQTILVPGPLYHTNSFSATNHLLAGDSVVLMERFTGEHALDLIERRRIDGLTAATVILQRMARVADVERRDLSSLRWVQQGAAVLPHWLARRWIDLVGPARFFMSYGMSEGLGLCAIRGDEWLRHPGSVGRPWGTTLVRIVGEDGHERPPGEIGEIFLRTPGGKVYDYVGDVPPLPMTADGFATAGDLGWVDDDGYVYIADRRVDMIVSGGANVYPAEVEAAIGEHPGIADVVVIGLADPEWGRRVHALVQSTDPLHPPGSDEIVGWARSRLAPYKVPKSVEFVTSLPRSEAGKLNRALLVAARDDDPTRAAEPADPQGPARPPR
jgi:bile acid-coenzyme A ligase